MYRCTASIVTFIILTEIQELQNASVSTVILNTYSAIACFIYYGAIFSPHNFDSATNTHHCSYATFQ